MKKLLSFLPLVLLLIALMAVGVSAAEAPEKFETSYPQRYSKLNITSGIKIEDYVTDELEQYLLDQFANCAEKVPVSQFNIPVRNNMTNQMKEYIWYEMPGAFHVHGMSIGNDGTYLTNIYPEYVPNADTVAEYKACSGEIAVAVESIMDGILGNNDLTDVERALLLHDRLALWTQYDVENLEANTIPYTAYSMYGVFAEQTAVCQGYTMAYMYVLDLVGIESDFCASDSREHCWNLVYIDGKPYHVDLTWDDPTCDLGSVKHDNFLRSTQGIIETGHDGGDFLTTPTDTTYDDYYWQDCYTGFVLLDSGLYFLSSEDATVRHADGNTVTTLMSIYDTWPAKDGSMWTNIENIAGLENMILYSQKHAIYAYDVDTGATALVFTPDLSESAYLWIYDFKYENGFLICELADDGDEQNRTIKYQVSEYFALSDETHTVTFQDFDGTVLSSRTYSYGAVPVQPEVSDYMEDGYRECWDKPVTVCRGSVVYRRSTRTTGQYKVEFRDWDDTVVEVGWYNINDKLHFPDVVLEREPDAGHTYRHDGWGFVSDICTGDMVIYAYYVESLRQYTIIFADWDGTTVSWNYCIYGTKIYFEHDNMEYLRQLFMRPNDEMFSYEFVGWDKVVDPYCHGDVTYTAVYNATLLPEFQNMTGWVQIDGLWRYLQNGEVVTGWKAIGGKWYYFNAQGIMQTGWLQQGSVWYYLNSSGVMVTGWLQLGSTWYYLDSSGAMVTGTVTIGGKQHRFDASGVWLGEVQQNGWVQQGGKWYYYQNGVKVTGWKQLSGVWYFFKTDGVMATGWQQVGSVWYYFQSSGAMVTGWKQIGSVWYYFQSSGAMQTGWLKLGNTWYYFHSSGAMATGSVKIGSKTYNFNSSGACLNP